MAVRSPIPEKTVFKDLILRTLRQSENKMLGREVTMAAVILLMMTLN